MKHPVLGNPLGQAQISNPTDACIISKHLLHIVIKCILTGFLSLLILCMSCVTFFIKTYMPFDCLLLFLCYAW